MEFVPERGRVIWVDFALKGTPVGQEMTKRRPCVVVQNNAMRRGELVTVVPISTVPPEKEEPFVHKMHHLSFVAWPQGSGRQGLGRWAKCDYVATVSLDRCTLPSVKKRFQKRKTFRVIVGTEDMGAIERGILWALGISLEGSD